MGQGLLLTALQHGVNVLAKPIPIPRPFVPSLQDRVSGRVVLVTGASSGIGRSLALRVAAAGATTVVTARRADNLAEIVGEIQALGGIAHAITADLASPDGVDAVASAVLGRFGAPDILVNNAGRSIRRTVAAAEHRLHDYERTMRLNYLAGVGLTLRLLPGMRRRGSGHIVHSSSVGVQGNFPSFSAYVGSKAALDAFLRIAAIESLADGVAFTNVHLPLIDTEMISPSNWSGFSTLTVAEAADLMVSAIRRRPRTLNSPMGSLNALGYAVLPGVVSWLQNLMHRRLEQNHAHLVGREPPYSATARA